MTRQWQKKVADITAVGATRGETVEVSRKSRYNVILVAEWSNQSAQEGKTRTVRSYVICLCDV